MKNVFDPDIKSVHTASNSLNDKPDLYTYVQSK